MAAAAASSGARLVSWLLDPKAKSYTPLDAAAWASGGLALRTFDLPSGTSEVCPSLRVRLRLGLRPLLRPRPRLVRGAWGVGMRVWRVCAPARAPARVRARRNSIAFARGSYLCVSHVCVCARACLRSCARDICKSLVASR